MWFRLFVTAMILVLLAVAPWWVGASIAVLAVVYFPHYLEVFVIALFVDMLHGSIAHAMWYIPFVYTTTAVVVYVVITQLKKRVFAYHTYHV